MKPLFGNPDSFLGGDADDDLPLVIGSTPPEEESVIVVLICHSCETTYSLPDEIDDARLLEMCPRCAHVFSSRAGELDDAAGALPDR